MKRCSECGQPCDADGVTRYDCADVKHRYHVDCWAAASWWLSGRDGKPTATFTAKVRAQCAGERR